jgi:dephospho-CoA kinase
MKVFGLTGGIGMGKSTAERWLQLHQVPVVDTDLLARRVVEPGQPALREIQAAFGDHIVGADGQLRREELARIVFSDPSARQKLEAATHPRIHDLWRKQIESWRGEGRPQAVVVIPLLFETGAEAEVDAVVCVACSPASQRQRLQERGWDPQQITRRIAAQWPIERKAARADYVVWTEGGLGVLGEQLERIFKARMKDEG